MDQAQIIEFTREAILLTITISAPVMIVGLLVGTAVSLVQALTQIQEMSLSFVPKILAIFATIFFMFPLMIASMTNFTTHIADQIARIGAN